MSLYLHVYFRRFVHSLKSKKLKKISKRVTLVVSNIYKLWFTNERSDEYKHTLTKKNLAASREDECQQFQGKKLSDKKGHSGSDEKKPLKKLGIVNLVKTF